jgi:hypothetical protein
LRDLDVYERRAAEVHRFVERVLEVLRILDREALAVRS